MLRFLNVTSQVLGRHVRSVVVPVKVRDGNRTLSTKYIHNHLCLWCERWYEHVHKFFRQDHKQFRGQCPYENCPEYHKGQNPTLAKPLLDSPRSEKSEDKKREKSSKTDKKRDYSSRDDWKEYTSRDKRRGQSSKDEVRDDDSSGSKKRKHSLKDSSREISSIRDSRRDKKRRGSL